MKKISQQNFIELGSARLGVLELADSARSVLLKYMSEAAADRLLSFDPAPVLVSAVDLLDKGQVQNGQPTFVLGWTGIWLTANQWSNEMAPIFTGAPSYAGHLYSGDYEPPVGTVIWAGLSEGGSPAAVIYMRPEQKEYRESLRTAGMLGTVGREMPLSLSFGYVKSDKQTQQYQGMEAKDKKFVSLDFVRRPGTDAARVDKSILLAEHKGQGGRCNRPLQGEGDMELNFSSEQELRESKLVQLMIAEQVALRSGDPESIKKIALSAPIELLKERADVKIYLERPTREAVLDSITEAELKALLEPNETLREVALSCAKDVQEKAVAFRPEAKKKLIELGLPEETAAVISLQEFGCDLGRVELAARQYLRAIDPESGGMRKGKTISEEPKLTAEDLEKRRIEGEKALKLARGR